MSRKYFCCCQTFWKVINIPNFVAHEIHQVYATGQNRLHSTLRKWPVAQQSSVLWTRLFGGLCSSLDNQIILTTYYILTTIQWKLMRKFELWKLRYSSENGSQIPEKDKESSKNRKKACHGGSQEGKRTQCRATTRVSKMWWWVLVSQLLSSAYPWIYIFSKRCRGFYLWLLKPVDSQLNLRQKL